MIRYSNMIRIGVNKPLVSSLHKCQKRQSTTILFGILKREVFECHDPWMSSSHPDRSCFAKLVGLSSLLR